MEKVEIKRGENISWTITLTDSTTGAAIVGASVAAEIRQADDTLIDTFTCTEGLDGVFVCAVDDTTEFPLGNLYTDVWIDDTTDISITDTILLKVSKNMTEAP